MRPYDFTQNRETNDEILAFERPELWERLVYR